MGITQRINSLLNYEIKIDLDRTIDRNKAIVLIGIILVVVTITGYAVGNRWFWVDNKNYYEYQIDNLKESLRKQPESNSIRVNLAMANYLNGDDTKSIGILRNILTEEPGNEPATLYLGLILSEQKEFKESVGLLTGYVKQNQGLETRIAYLYLGRDYLALGKNDLALKYLGYAAARDPGNPVVYYCQGQAYEQLKDKKNAIAAYERALRISPDYTEAENALKALIKSGN